MRYSVSLLSLALLFLSLPTAALAQLAIMPGSQTISAAGNAATYVVMVTNPTGTSQTFVPSVSGSVNPSWGVELPASVAVGSGGSQTFNVVLSTPLNLPNGHYLFTVTVNTITDLSYSISATLIVSAASPSATPVPPSLLLALIGLAGLGIWAARSRRRQTFSRG